MNMDRMISYLESLKDSNMVWEFQKYFGVRKVVKQCGGPNARSNGSSELYNQTQVGEARTRTETQTRTETLIADGKDRVSQHTNGYLNHLSHRRDPSDVGTVSSDSCVDEEETYSDSESGDGLLVDRESFVITNKLWYYLFCFGSWVGDEMFYASFFPFWFWNIDGAVGRRVVMVWVMVMYIGQGLKDVICWPRPFCPPAVRLEKKWALEFGMPSTHAMVGACVPFSVLYYTMYRYEYPVFVGVLLSCAWCTLVCCSRVYMGMHSVLDVVCGLALSVVLLCIYLPALDSLDHFQLTYPYSPVIVIGLILIMVVVYPSGPKWTPARGDTTVILGTGAGFSLGSWLNYQLGIIRGPILPPPYTILWPSYEMVGLGFLRLCIGILSLVATRAFFKSVSYIIVCWILRLNPQDVGNKQKIAVELSCKFITYAVMGFNITYLSPAVFRFLNIERITFYTEV